MDGQSIVLGTGGTLERLPFDFRNFVFKIVQSPSCVMSVGRRLVKKDLTDSFGPGILIQVVLGNPCQNGLRADLSGRGDL